MPAAKKTTTKTAAAPPASPAVSPVARVVRTGGQVTSGAILAGVLASFVTLTDVQVLAISGALTWALAWLQNLAEAKGWIPTLTVKPSGDAGETRWQVPYLVAVVIVALIALHFFGFWGLLILLLLIALLF